MLEQPELPPQIHKRFEFQSVFLTTLPEPLRKGVRKVFPVNSFMKEVQRKM